MLPILIIFQDYSEFTTNTTYIFNIHKIVWKIQWKNRKVIEETSEVIFACRPTPLSQWSFFETALRHVNCARSPVWNSWRAAEILGGCVPLSPFVLRPFVRWVRSLSHCSAPVVEVDAKVGVLSREKGVPGACLAALPVLPVIPNFLASTRACRSRMTLPSPVSPVWYARHYSRANTLNP